MKPVKTSDGSITMQLEGQDETFHSSLGALSEAKDLYVKSSNLEQYFLANNTCHILDIGLGLGYNALASIEAWQQSSNPCNTTLISLEIRPDLPKQLATGKAEWQENWPDYWNQNSQELIQENHIYTAKYTHEQNAKNLNWTILVGDAKDFDQNIKSDTRFNFFWQDPFSKKFNEELWQIDWFQKLRTHASTDAVLMSYSVAGEVRRSLEATGWSPERFETGHKQKRHWLRAKPINQEL